MTVQIEVPAEAAERALLRSQAYRVLALAFRHPDRDTVRALSEAATALAAVGAGRLPGPVREGLADLATALDAATLEDVQEQYVGTFGHVTVPDCPLYETACGAGDPFLQPQTLADLAGFYRAFGLEMAGEAHERADHLSVELEFMHYLAYREAYALERHGPERTATVRDAQGRFLEAHLGRWAPIVARAVSARSEGTLGAAARVLERLLADEVEGRGISPAPVVAEGAPLTIPPLDDGDPAGEDDDFTGREP
jgi:DMSO reductase family type II enzyme chaperone